MTREIEVRKSLEKPLPEALWWKPLFDWQKEANEVLRSFTPAFMPRSFWDSETRMFGDMQRSMNRVFGQMFNNRHMMTPWWMGTRAEPYVDIVENGDGYVIKADVPGIDAEDLDVEVTDGSLLISGEREEYREKEEGNFIRRECQSGAFSRVIALPADADPDSVSANFDRNVLTVRIARKRETNGKARKSLPVRERSGTASQKRQAAQSAQEKR